MRSIYILLMTTAAFLSTLIIGLIIVTLYKGDFNLLLPGLGLILSGRFIILLLTIVDAVIITLALFFRSMSRK